MKVDLQYRDLLPYTYESPNTAEHIRILSNMQGMLYNKPLKTATEQARRMRFFHFHSCLLITVIAPK